MDEPQCSVLSYASYKVLLAVVVVMDEEGAYFLSGEIGAYKKAGGRMRGGGKEAERGGFSGAEGGI